MFSRFLAIAVCVVSFSLTVFAQDPTPAKPASNGSAAAAAPAAALARFDQPGYQITAIPDKKKQRGFRLVDPDGYTTDYYLDSKTGRVMSFFLYYGGATLGTENSKFKEVEGVLVPFSFSQKFEMPVGAFFAEFSVKEVKINQQLPDDAFAIPR